MEITDQSIIDRRINDVEENEDGLFAICCQGRVVVEMDVLHGHEKNDWGATVEYSMYRIAIFRHESDSGQEVFNLQDIDRVKFSQGYVCEGVEYWGGAGQHAHLRFASLVVQHNHF